MIDTLPLWVCLPALLWWAWAALVIVREVRAANREYKNARATDPVVVTGSGRHRDSRPYACKSAGGVR